MKQSPDFDRIQSRMAPGVLTLHGFLGNDERKLMDILSADQATVASAGLTHAALAERLLTITHLGADLMEGSVLVENRYQVHVRDDRGAIPCPWGDGLFGKGDTEMTDQRTGKTFRWNPLTLHMIGTHGFYNGKGGEYRNEPSDLIESLDLKSSEAIDDSKIEPFFTRRSIRRYTSQSVSEDLIDRLLQVAMQAPSAGNEQPWQFVVIRNRGLLDKIPTVHPYAQMVKAASVAILVCGDERLEKYKGFWVQDCSAATQNLLMAAHLLGLGAVWLGIYPIAERVEGVRTLFHLPPEVIPLALIPVGYPVEAQTGDRRYQAERIHRDLWQP